MLNKGLNLRKHFFTQQVVDNWNRLLAKVVKAKTTNQLKNSFDKYLNENGYGDPISIFIQVFVEAVRVLKGIKP